MLEGFHPSVRSWFEARYGTPTEMQVLYVSPLKALANDVRMNLLEPLAELRRLPGVPEIRAAVRTGDTPQAERQALLRRPPHVLVTTPESFYLLLTSEGGRKTLRTVRTVIVDEIHAVARDKRRSEERRVGKECRS